MLADLAQELAPQLIRRLQAVSASGLVSELVATLRRQSVDAAACDRFVAIGFDVESTLTALGHLREALYDAIEERGPVVPPRELRLLGDWFAVLSERMCR